MKARWRYDWYWDCWRWQQGMNSDSVRVDSDGKVTLLAFSRGPFPVL